MPLHLFHLYALGAALIASTGLHAPTVDILDGATRIGPAELGANLAGNARFGSSVAAIGDLNGDGIEDIAVGAVADGDGLRRGAVWILFLKPDQSVGGRRRITAGTSGFTGPLNDHDRFGSGIAFLGDLDNDGRPEIAVGTPGAGESRRGAVWILSLNRDGSVHAEHTIAMGTGGLDETLAPGDFFGFAVASLAVRGSRSLVVGAPYALHSSGRRGSVWILRLSADGTVLASERLDASGRPFGAFGYGVASAGDLDGDGRDELAIGEPLGGELRSGAMWIMFLDDRGRVRRQTRIAQDEGGFAGRLDAKASFGAGLTACGDVDGDGTPDFATGAPGATGADVGGEVWLLLLRPDGSVRAQERLKWEVGNGFGQALASIGGDGPGLVAGTAKAAGGGAVWCLSLGGCLGSSSSTRNGYGLNPRILTSTSTPRAGALWTGALDCTGFEPGLAVLVGSSAPNAGLITGGGELLIDFAPGRRVFTITVPHAGDALELQTSLPNDVSFCNYAIYVQGSCGDASRSTLSNALDLVLGR